MPARKLRSSSVPSVDSSVMATTTTTTTAPAPDVLDHLGDRDADSPWDLSPGERHLEDDADEGTPLPIEEFLVSGAVETCLVTPDGDEDDDEDAQGRESGTNTIRNSECRELFT